MSVALGIVLALGVIGTALAFVIPRIIATKAEGALWKPLPSAPGAMVLLPAPRPEVTVGVVDQRLQYAVSSLVRFGPWPAATLFPALADLRIIVNTTVSWIDFTGRQVGGQAYYSTIAVDLGLTSLCHEIAHVLEFRLDGKTDDLHQNWERRGITAADNEYRGKIQ